MPVERRPGHEPAFAPGSHRDDFDGRSRFQRIPRCLRSRKAIRLAYAARLQTSCRDGQKRPDRCRQGGVEILAHSGQWAMGSLRLKRPIRLSRGREDLNKLLGSAGGKFPTGAMASFRFDGAWKALEPYGAVLASYITPKTIAVLSHDRREQVLQRCR